MVTKLSKLEYMVSITTNTSSYILAKSEYYEKARIKIQSSKGYKITIMELKKIRGGGDKEMEDDRIGNP